MRRFVFQERVRRHLCSGLLSQSTLVDERQQVRIGARQEGVAAPDRRFPRKFLASPYLFLFLRRECHIRLALPVIWSPAVRPGADERFMGRGLH